MKNIINYYYNFDVTNLRTMKEEHYFFHFRSKQYLFYKIDYKIELDYLSSLINIIQNIPFFHTIIMNREGNMVTFDGRNYYILLQINIDQNKWVSIEEILQFKSYSMTLDLPKELSRSNWIDLWAKKIDYLEYYMENKDNIGDEVKCIFHYFVGLGENAIQYIKKAMYEKENTLDHLVLSHKRITDDYTLYDLYNPLNLIIDHESRDIAEYLKSLFYTKEYNANTIDQVISKTNLSRYGYTLLMGRILFPTFFFDLLDEHEINDLSFEQILGVYDRIDEYEQFISSIASSIKKNKNISLINVLWLNHSSSVI